MYVFILAMFVYCDLVILDKAKKFRVGMWQSIEIMAREISRFKKLHLHISSYKIMRVAVHIQSFFK